jgi:integrase
MAIYQKRGHWYAKVKDGRGVWKGIALEGAETKTAAKALAAELEAKYRRQRLGLDALPSDCTLTLEAACDKWLKHLAGRPSHDTGETFIRCHIRGTELGALTLPCLTAPALETFLESKEGKLAPESINYLRGCISRALSYARTMGLWDGENVVGRVPKRHVPRRAADYLRAEEVAPVLEVVGRRWRNLFATAIFTGLRKGELCALRKQDVDLPARRIVVSQSWERGIPKGGRIESVPIAEELVPYLQAALDASPSELVFPAVDGSMLARGVPLQNVLRRALGRAGIVTGYRHICRKRGCTYVETAPDQARRFCTTHLNAKLWPKPDVRPIRFHDLRHTTASLLLAAGAPLHAAQKIMRHADPKVTAETYGHLEHGYLKAEVDRLSFGLVLPAELAPEAAKATGTDDGLLPPLLPETASGAEPLESIQKAQSIPAFLVGASGVEPPTSTVSR